MEALDISKSGQSAKLKIKPEAFKDLVIKYQLNAMTTKAEDNGEKKGAMDDWFGIIQKMPNELQSVRDQGKEINWELVFNMYGQYSGLPELEKVWQDVTPEERAAEQQQLQSESIQPDQPHVDYRIMGDMDPQQVSDVMAQNGHTQTLQSDAPLPWGKCLPKYRRCISCHMAQHGASLFYGGHHGIPVMLCHVPQVSSRFGRIRRNLHCVLFNRRDSRNRGGQGVGEGLELAQFGIQAYQRGGDVLDGRGRVLLHRAHVLVGMFREGVQAVESRVELGDGCGQSRGYL